MSVSIESEGSTFVVAAPRPANDLVRDVADDIARAIRDCGYAALRGLACEFHAGVATLRGRVPSWHLRQVAQNLVRRVPGVVRLVDCLEVVEPGADIRCRRPAR